MSRRLATSLSLVTVALGGCAFDPAGTPVGDGGGAPVGDGAAPADAAELDGGVDAGCTCPLGCALDGVTCAAFEPSNLDDVALLDGVTAPLLISAGAWTLDTGAMELRDPAGALITGPVYLPIDGGTSPDLLVIAVARLDVAAGATLRIVGDPALLVLSREAITIDGVVDLSAGCLVDPSVRARDRLWCGGPGAGDGSHPDPGGNGGIAATGCAPGGDGDAGPATNEHGGGGGGFGGAGGDGGGVDGSGPDSEGGAVCGPDSLEPLRGGSGGGAAGYVRNSNDDGRTTGGGGGGALQLLSLDAVIIRGTIDASGEGGAGTAQAGSYTPPGTDGGGGGGSGGAILLEAPAISLGATAVLVANGGGGGAGITLDRHGARGARARSRAAGGLNDNGTGGGLGGFGDGDDEQATAGAAPGDGGSGGGGGAGRIHLHGAAIGRDVNAVLSPTPTEALLIPRTP